MEKKTYVTKYRWYIQIYENGAWSSVMNSKGIIYYDSFKELASAAAKRIDARTDLQFRFMRETYYAEA